MKKFTKLSKAEMKKVVGGDYDSCFRACIRQAYGTCNDLNCLNNAAAGCAANCSVAQP